MVKSSSSTLENGGILNKNKPIFNIALDIGTSKVCALISTMDPTNTKLEVVGLGIAESDGLQRGVITNIEKTANAISNAMEKAMQQSNLRSNKVIVSLSGDYIKSEMSSHVVSISNAYKEIRKEDVDRLINEARNMQIQPDRRIIHLFPQDYTINGINMVSDPIGMSGVRMEAKIHVVTAPLSAIENLYRCAERVGVEITDIVLAPYASSLAILEEDEKEVGVAVIDIGAGTTEIAVFYENAFRFSEIIAFGGNQLTQDIRRVLGVVKTNAEKLKKDYGHCFIETLHKNEELQVQVPGGNAPVVIDRKYLTQILGARVTEILLFANLALEQSGYKNNLKSGVVLTGGTSLLPGIEELAQRIFGLPVRLGLPSKVSSFGLAPEVINPVFSVAVGLAIYGFQTFAEQNKQQKERIQPKFEQLEKEIEKEFSSSKEDKIEEAKKEDPKKEEQNIEEESEVIDLDSKKTKIAEFIKNIFDKF